MKTLIITLLLMSHLVFGNTCDKPVTYLKEGIKAPCTGYLFTPEQELLVRSQDIKYKELENLFKTQGEMINLLSNRLDLSQQNNNLLNKQIKEIKNINDIDKIIYFCLGILVSITVNKALK